MIVLGNDPGIVNYGIALLEIEPKRYRLHRNTLLKSPLYNLHQETYLIEARRYTKAVSRFLKGTPQLDLLVMERFQTRGFQGKGIEVINVMIGLLSRHLSPPNCLLLTATWKGVLKRLKIDLKSIYKMGKKEYGLEPHLIDAALLALSAYGTYTGDNGHIRALGSKSSKEYLLNQISCTSI